jgi:hypothetical protein
LRNIGSDLRVLNQQYPLTILDLQDENLCRTPS